MHLDILGFKEIINATRQGGAPNTVSGNPPVVRKYNWLKGCYNRFVRKLRRDAEGPLARFGVTRAGLRKIRLL